ncbi:MAG: hypothetical protein AABY13_01390 [Nanoarchaeota archaeon]
MPEKFVLLEDLAKERSHNSDVMTPRPPHSMHPTERAVYRHCAAELRRPGDVVMHFSIKCQRMELSGNPQSVRWEEHEISHAITHLLDPEYHITHGSALHLDRNGFLAQSSRYKKNVYDKMYKR